MEMIRKWAMPNKETFKIKPIKQLIKQEKIFGEICDPFPYPYKEDALKYMKSFKDNSVIFGLYDPPYSLRQLKECYESKGLALTTHETQSYWNDIDKEWDRIIKPGGKVIKFGWNSKRLSKSFEIKKIMLVNHGGNHNDTICTIQTKVIGDLYV